LRFVIHYEDSPRAGGPKPPPLHRLVLRSVADVHGIPDSELHGLEHRLIPISLGGAGNLKNRLCDRAKLDRLRLQHIRALLFLFDFDRAPKLVPTTATCKSGLKRELLRQAGDPEDLRILFLDRNLESLLRCLRELEPELLTPTAWEDAIEHKKLLDRDLALSKAAKAPQLRAALRERHPSWAYAIRSIASCLGPTPA
jgi:hypothetical protein